MNLFRGDATLFSAHFPPEAGPERYTRSGIRRAGDDYQDVVALALMIEMLEHPDRYVWLAVEADDVGALDDVIALQSDGVLVVKQVKFSGHPDGPDDAYSWPKLLAEGKGVRGKTRSLLQKWNDALAKVQQRSGKFEASVQSNRRAGADLMAALLPAGYVDFDRIGDLPTREAIMRQLGGEEATRKFFRAFRFDLDRPSLSGFEENLQRRFLDLGGTEGGWERLRGQLRRWVRHRDLLGADGRITLTDVKAACLWHLPQALPQAFPVPADFVVPSKEFHDELMCILVDDPGRDWLAIAGPPGVGKSTYLSFLFAELAGRGVASIRHHFFLSWVDTTPGRRNARRVAESLMSDIARTVPEIYHLLSAKNPGPDDLAAWIEAAAEHLRRSGRRLVLILDGLDHVWRDEQSLKELNELFGLLPMCEGFRLVVGTQPVDDAQLPSRLLRFAPRSTWKRLPLLDKQAVRSLVVKHLDETALAEQDSARELERLTDLLIERSGGLALYLRYVFNAIKEQGKSISVDTIEGLPECPHQDITRYYQGLWSALAEPGRQILHLVTACAFSWPELSIVDCLDPEGNDRPAVEAALRQTRHLLQESEFGQVPSHSSLTLFIKSTPEHLRYAELLKRRVLSWLKERAPEHWKWAFTWTLQAELGEPRPLLEGPTRQWLVEALVQRRSAAVIYEILTKAAWVALQRRDLGRFVELGLLSDYYDHATKYRDTTVQEMVFAQLRATDDPLLAVRLRSEDFQSDATLITLAEFVSDQGRFDEPLRALQIIEERRMLIEPPITREAKERWAEHTGSAFRLVALNASVPPAVVRRMLARKSSRGFFAHFLDIYASAARRFGASEQAMGLLRVTRRWPPCARRLLFNQFVPLACELGFRIPADVLTETDDDISLVRIDAILARKGTHYRRAVDIPRPWVLTLPPAEFYGNVGEIASLFHRIFFSCVSNAISGFERAVKDYVGRLCDEDWASIFLRRLVETARDAATTLQDNAIRYDWLYSRLGGLTVPRFGGENREEFYVGQAATDAIYMISRDLSLLSRRHSPMAVGRGELERASSSEFLSLDRWISVYVSEGSRWLSGEAAKWLLDHQAGRLVDNIEMFSARSSRFVELANLAALHDLDDAAVSLLRKTAENLVSYGDRKDYLLDSAMEVIRCAAENGMSEDARRWIKALGPVVAAVTEFTDGKGTRHLPQTLGAIMAEHFPDLFQDYYLWLVSEEHYYDAEDVFSSFIEYADLFDPLQSAIVRTGIDEVSLFKLKRRVENHDIRRRFSPEEVGFAPPIDDPEERGTTSEPRVPNEALSFSYSQYGPESLDQFVAELRAAGALSTDRFLEEWARFWAAQGRASEVLVALNRDGAPKFVFGDQNLKYDLAVQVLGYEGAFAELVEAQRAYYGWSRYFTNKEVAIARWTKISQCYPERWFEFVEKTIIDNPFEHRSVVGAEASCLRLMEYCVYFGELVLARNVGDAIVQGILETVSPLRLRVPGWLADHA